MKYPINHSLWGDFDTWANLAMFYELNLFFEFNTDGKSFIYPYSAPWLAFGWDFFSGIFWVLFYKFGLDEIWAYWLYMTLILTLNAFSLFLFLSTLIKDFWIKFFASMVFVLHPFMFICFDNPNIIIYFFSFTGLYFLIKYFKENKRKHLIFFNICVVLQLYFSPIVFAATFFLIIFILLFYLKKIKFKSFFISSLFVLIFISPYIYSYFYFDKGMTSLELLKDSEASFYYRFYSFELLDLIRATPNHILYGKNTFYNQPFISLKHMFLGWILSIFLIVGLFYKRNFPYLIFLVFIFLLGMGHFTFIHDDLFIKSPLYYIYNNLGFESVFKIPSRFNLLFLLISIIIAYRSLDFLVQRHSKLKIIFYLLAFLIVLESTLWEKELYNSKNQLQYFANINHYMLNNNENSETTLNLPTGIIYDHNDRREFLYMINRTIQKNNTVNGSVAYYPESRLELWKFLNRERINPDDFCNYIKKRKITSVLVFPKLCTSEIEEEQINVAQNCSCLELEKSFDNGIIYRVKH